MKNQRHADLEVVADAEIPLLADLGLHGDRLYSGDRVANAVRIAVLVAELVVCVELPADRNTTVLAEIHAELGEQRVISIGSICAEIRGREHLVDEGLQPRRSHRTGKPNRTKEFVHYAFGLSSVWPPM